MYSKMVEDGKLNVGLWHSPVKTHRKNKVDLSQITSAKKYSLPIDSEIFSLHKKVLLLSNDYFAILNGEKVDIFEFNKQDEAFKHIATLKSEDQKEITQVVQLSDQLLATAGFDKIIRIWDWQKGECIKKLVHQDILFGIPCFGWHDYFMLLAASGHKKLISGAARQLYIWDLETSDKKTIDTEFLRCNGLSVSENGAMVTFHQRDLREQAINEIHLWTPEGQHKAKLVDNVTWQHCLLPNNHLAVIDKEGTMHIYHIVNAQFKELHSFDLGARVVKVLDENKKEITYKEPPHLEQIIPLRDGIIAIPTRDYPRSLIKFWDCNTGHLIAEHSPKDLGIKRDSQLILMSSGQLINFELNEKEKTATICTFNNNLSLKCKKEIQEPIISSLKLT